MPAKCLFSAPFAFIPGIADAYNAVVPTEFREIWSRNEIVPDPDLTAWVMNPGQNFVIDAAVLSEFPRLRVLSSPSTGTNHIDRRACADRNVSVFCLLDRREQLEAISASAEFTFLLLLNALRRLDVAVDEVSAGRWREREDLLRGNELSEKKVGLIGFGRIGRRLKRYCEAFDASVVVNDPYVQVPSEISRPLTALFEECDAVICCCALTDETKGMIGENLLRRLKRGAVFVNSSRGEVLDERALAEIAVARLDLRIAVDVISGEVTSSQFRSPLIPLHMNKQIVVTPHIAGATVESQRKAALIALSLLRRHLEAPTA